MVGPVEFQHRALKRTLWRRQREICAASQSQTSLSIAGCHGSGKSFVLSGLVPYELLSDRETLVLTIAPTLRQVKTFWNEVSAAIGSMRYKGEPPSTTGWRISEKNYALGFSASKGVNAQGFHSKRILILVDEAIGISSDLWDAIEGIRSAGDVRIIKACNPTVPNGPVFDDFTKNRSVPGHRCMTISAFDTPNLLGLTMESLLQLPDEQLDVTPFPHLTRRRWVKEMYYKWGPNNARFLSRVLGQFPTQATDAVFELAWIEAAAALDEEEFDKQLRNHRERAFIQVGLDIAGPGEDETAICARIGPFVVAAAAWPKPDPLNEVLQFVSRLLIRFPQVPLVIMADVVGIGYHFARAIARQGFDVREFRAGAAPIDPVMFKNAKAEEYWRCREHMRAAGIHGVSDEDTKAQLSDVRYRELMNGKVEIEYKDEARARGSSSPDRAEALILAFAAIVPKEQTVVLNADYQISPY